MLLQYKKKSIIQILHLVSKHKFPILQHLKDRQNIHHISLKTGGTDRGGLLLFYYICICQLENEYQTTKRNQENKHRQKLDGCVRTEVNLLAIMRNKNNSSPWLWQGNDHKNKQDDNQQDQLFWIQSAVMVFRATTFSHLRTQQCFVAFFLLFSIEIVGNIQKFHMGSVNNLEPSVVFFLFVFLVDLFRHFHCSRNLVSMNVDSKGPEWSSFSKLINLGLTIWDLTTS